MPILTPPSSYTTNYNLAKWVDNARPGATALNANWDQIDAAIFGVQAQVTALDTPSILFADKIDVGSLEVVSEKLKVKAGVFAANSHSHAAADIVESVDKQFVTYAERLQISSSSVGVEKTVNKGVANGYAGLGADAKVPLLQLPSASVIVIVGSGSAATNSMFIDSNDFLLKHKDNTGNIFTLSKKTQRRNHSWVIGGDVTVASGSSDYIGGFCVDNPTGQSSFLTGARYCCYSGTVLTHIYINDVVQVASMSVSVTPGSQSITPISLNTGDWVRIVVGSASAASILQFNIYEDVTF